MISTSIIAEQFREEGYAIVRQLFDGDTVKRLQRETADLYQLGIEHPVTYKHANLAYEILPEKYFDQRYMIQPFCSCLNRCWLRASNRLLSRFIGSHQVQR